MRRVAPLLACSVALALLVSVPLASAEDAATPVDQAVATGSAPADGAPTPADGGSTADAPTPDAPAPATDPARTASPTTPAGPTPRAATLTIHATDRLITFGQSITLSGDLAPGVAGAMVVEQAMGGGMWSTVASTSTDAAGHWSVAYNPQSNVTLRARMSDNSATSAQLTVDTMPTLQVSKVPKAAIFVGAHLHARVRPATYRGKVTLSVRYKGRVRGSVTGRPKNGVLDVTVPTIGIGRLPVAVTLAAGNDMHAGTASTAVKSTIRNLSQGSRGTDVRALLKRMRYLNFHTPGLTSRYDFRVGEVVLAFHKWKRMKRTYSVERSTWDRIAQATPMKPHFKTKATHIEVDKTRQILSVVKKGEVVGTIHVSTGATGNTPVGHFHIYQRGGSHLYKFMAFLGNFGIHGYVPVPAFPASHGCVREPMWAAAWTFSQVDYGTSVYIYT